MITINAPSITPSWKFSIPRTIKDVERGLQGLDVEDVASIRVMNRAVDDLIEVANAAQEQIKDYEQALGDISGILVFVLNRLPFVEKLTNVFSTKDIQQWCEENLDLGAHVIFIPDDQIIVIMESAEDLALFRLKYL